MTQVLQILKGGSLLHQLVRDMTTELDRRFSALGLTSQQAALLLTVSDGTSSPARLAESVGTDTAGMTKLLDRLERKGLAQRRSNPADRRSVLVEPTERGLAVRPKLIPVFGEMVGQLFKGFSDAEVSEFESLLERMRENLRAEPRGTRSRTAVR